MISIGIAAITISVTACNDYDPRRVPKAAGNTFDRFNFLSNVNPRTQRLGISYEYVMVGQQGLYIPEVQEGQFWQYAEQSAVAPDEFVGVHMAVLLPEERARLAELAGTGGVNLDTVSDPLAPSLDAPATDDAVTDPLAADTPIEGDAPSLDGESMETGTGDGFAVPAVARDRTVRLGSRSFSTVNYCVGPGREDPGPRITAYIDVLHRLGYPLSDYLYVQRYRMRPDDDDDAARLDIIYVRDIVRDGYTCNHLGDLQNPEDEEKSELIRELEARSQRSFEIFS